MKKNGGEKEEELIEKNIFYLFNLIKDKKVDNEENGLKWLEYFKEVVELKK
jgi:hypothetical protein